MKTRLIIACLSALLYGQDTPRATGDYGAFALPDQAGTRLIVPGGVPRAADLRGARCSDGRNRQVRFQHAQNERPGNYGRQTPYTFDYLSGDVFQLTGTPVTESEACFVVGNGWLAQADFLPTQEPETPAPCGSLIEARLSKSRTRAVKQCTVLSRLGKEGHVVIAEFSRIGKDALASLVLVNNSRLLFADFPAEYRGEGSDLWRVDDGGELSAGAFQLVFVAHRAGRYALGIGWDGAEGRSLTLFVSGPGNQFEIALSDYWYHAPL